MTINGNIKFFSENHIDDDSTLSFTSANTALASSLFDRDRTTKLISIGSDDVTPEVWEFTFGSAQTIDRVYLDNHNIKSGAIKYWNGAAFVDFSPAISLSGNSDPTNYWEVSQISTLKIQITMDTTFVVDDQKSVGEFRVMEELGIVETNPIKADPKFPDKKINHKTGKGSSVYVSFGEPWNGDFNFSDASANDVTLFRTLKDRTEPFFIFPGGGVDKTQIGFRLRDMYFVNYVNDFEPKIKGNIFDIGTAIKLELDEA